MHNKPRDIGRHGQNAPKAVRKAVHAAAAAEVCGRSGSGGDDGHQDEQDDASERFCGTNSTVRTPNQPYVAVRRAHNG